jgi:hypothetical protein
MSEERKRWTLRELAALARGTDGWTCRTCGCRDWRIVNSHHRSNGRVRQRVCRHCGEVIATLEIPITDEEESRNGEPT